MEKQRLPLQTLIILILFTPSSFVKAQSEITVKPMLVSISVSDLERSSKWYSQTLGFELAGKPSLAEPKTQAKLLKLNDFCIELQRKENACPRNLIAVPEDSELCGYFKIGFRVTDFENYHQELKLKNPGYLTDIITSPYSGSIYFYMKDPDSNLIQIFPNPNPDAPQRVKPYLVGITVDNMEKQIEWYEQNLGFSFLQKWDVTDSHLYVRLLLSESLIIELRKEQLNPVHRSALKMPQGKSELQGICRMAFKVENLSVIAEQLKTNQVRFVKELTFHETAGSTKYIVIADPENNMIQLME
jgi:catechol 2,3-dioxygenase-like lactoylglutathione lyase family enzyme